MTILSRQENKENNAAPYRQEEHVKAANSLPDLAPEDGDALPF